MPEIQSALVLKVSEGTDEGFVRWEAANANSFRATFKNGSVVIQRISFEGPADEHNSSIEIRVFNKTGKMVDQFDDSDLDNISKPPGGANHWYHPLKILHDKARRMALGSDEVISSIIGEIDADLEIPF